MARGKLWSVKGVSTDAREAAKAAAQNSGQPIGAWIDQAVRMTDDNEEVPNTRAASSSDATEQIDIVEILQSIEERVANHADRISDQLVPFRDSIAQLADRLQQLEQTNTHAELPETTPSAPVIDPAPSSPEPDHLPEAEDQEPTVAEEKAASTPELEPEPESETPEQPRRRAAAVTEEDIHAADAALKSELTGLFDDGAHRGAARPRFTNTGDPFIPPPPPPIRRPSRAPLIFVIVILLTACAGIGAFAWFEFLSPETRQSFRSLTAITEQESTEATDTNDATGATTPTPAALVEPQVAQAPTPPPAPSVPEPTEVSQPPEAAPEPTPPPAVVPAPPAAPSAPQDPAVPANAVNNELKGLIRDASAGSATAQNELGVRYLVGRGIAQDYGQAALWLRKAAAQDMTNAQYNLGVLFDSGRGVEPDPIEALIWFHSAAENGHGRAQMAVAAAYAAGRGIERNPNEALKWLRRAAESKIPEAQFSLANILATSPKTHESLIDAYYWYKIADSKGIAEAAERGEQVATRLTAEERAGVNKRVSHYIGQSIPRPPTRSGDTEPHTEKVSPSSDSPSGAQPGATQVSEKPAKPVSRSIVTQTQLLLAELGFDAGPADGTIGSKTREAIRNYQTEMKMKVDGEPSLALLAELRQVVGKR